MDIPKCLKTEASDTGSKDLRHPHSRTQTYTNGKSKVQEINYWFDSCTNIDIDSFKKNTLQFFYVMGR